MGSARGAQPGPRASSDCCLCPSLAELNKHKAFVHEDEGMEALHDHYYPDWMDFGRRSAEDELGAV